MAVPKCKGCKSYKEGEALFKNTRSSMRRITSLKKIRYCIHPETGTVGYPSIELNELKTSPKWCPLRIK